MKVEMVRQARPTVEGAGVNLVRAFDGRELPQLDPFLMLDDFSSNDPSDYGAGFPSHPHRGMETITYMLQGYTEHHDGIGNRGRIGPGEVQWMTAGSGIIHGEMPRGEGGRLQGYQLWVNLPQASKMMAPRYRDVRRDEIPAVRPAEGVEVKVIAGTVGGVQGPVRDLVVPVEYLDVSLRPGVSFEQSVPEGWASFAYVIEGKGNFGTTASEAGAQSLVVFGGQGSVIASSREGVRFLLVSGRPLREPIAWRGPVVMNTEGELRRAFEEIREGNFVKCPAEER